MKDTSWDRALEIAADGNGLVGHAGGILMRKLADQCGLTGALNSALTLKRKKPQLSRGMVLVSTAIAIAMGATAMADIAVLGQLAPVLGDAPSASTVRRVLDMAAGHTLTRIAQARARIRRHVWGQIEDAGGFPWIEVAGKTLDEWLVIDMDATLITAHSDKEGARPTWKMGYGFHPLAAWCINTRECLSMLLRPGSDGSDTFAGHKEVLAGALKQVPASFRRKILVRVDGAGASHKLIEHLISLSTAPEDRAVHLRLDHPRRRRAGHRSPPRSRLGTRAAPPSRPTASAPLRRWACATFHRKPGRSTSDG